MMIREQAKKIQLLRTHYVPEKKRTVSRMFASISISTDNIKDVDKEVLALLDSTEKEKLTKWFDNRRVSRALKDGERTLTAISDFMDKASAALSEDFNAALLGEKKARDIYISLSELGKALRKAGYIKSDLIKKKSV